MTNRDEELFHAYADYVRSGQDCYSIDPIAWSFAVQWFVASHRAQTKYIAELEAELKVHRCGHVNSHQTRLRVISFAMLAALNLQKWGDRNERHPERR